MPGPFCPSAWVQKSPSLSSDVIPAPHLLDAFPDLLVEALASTLPPILVLSDFSFGAVVSLSVAIIWDKSLDLASERHWNEAGQPLAPPSSYVGPTGSSGLRSPDSPTPA